MVKSRGAKPPKAKIQSKPQRPTRNPMRSSDGSARPESGPLRPRPPFKPKGPMRATPQSPPVRLSESMLGAWRKTILSIGRLPRGLDRTELTEEDLVDMLVRQETSTVSHLWETFTQDRGNLSKNLLSPAQNVVGYLLGFHLANAARAQVTLMRAFERHPSLKSLLKSWGREAVAETSDDKQPLVAWHDLGAGTGAVGHTAMEFLIGAGMPGPRMGLNLYDNTGPLLDASRTLLERAALGVDVRTHKVPLERLDGARMRASSGKKLTAFSLGYVWNEIRKNPEGRKRVLAAVEDLAKRGDNGLVLVLEPGIQELARQAMDLRDQLTRYGYVPLYPCPNAGPCPMRERVRDWCFSESQFDRPRELQRLDHRLGLDRSALAGSFYLFATPALAEAMKFKPLERSVVVGRPEMENGYEYLLCEGTKLRKQPPKDITKPVARGMPLETTS